MPQIQITCNTPDASIYYTTDGNDPSGSSNLYSSPFEINTACTLKTLGIKEGCEDSDVSSLSVQTINYNFDWGTDLVSIEITNPENIELGILYLMQESNHQSFSSPWHFSTGNINVGNNFIGKNIKLYFNVTDDYGNSPTTIDMPINSSTLSFDLDHSVGVDDGSTIYINKGYFYIY